MVAAAAAVAIAVAAAAAAVAVAVAAGVAVAAVVPVAVAIAVAVAVAVAAAAAAAGGAGGAAFFFCCSRGPSASAPKSRARLRQAAGERRWGRWLSEKVAEEGRISVDIGCTGKREGEGAACEGTRSGTCEQGGPPQHIGRDAGTLQWWGGRPGSATGKEPEEGNSFRAPSTAGFYAEHD